MAKVVNRYKETEQEQSKETNQEETKAKSGLIRKPSNRSRSVLGLSLIFIGLFILLACISYMFTWKVDQDSVFQHQWAHIFDKEFQVTNIFGKLGALVSHQLVYNLFGISTLLISILFLILGVNLFLNKTVAKPGRWALGITLFILFFSLISSYVAPNASFSWGGATGQYSNHWLTSILGKVGTGLFYLFALVASVIFYFNLNPIRLWNALYVHSNNDAEDESIITRTAIDTDDLDEKPVAKNSLLEEEESEEEEEIADEDEEEEEEDGPTDFEIITTQNSSNGVGEVQTTKRTSVPAHQGESVGLEVQNNAVEQSVDELVHEYDPTLDLSNFKFPSLDLLENHGDQNVEIDREELEKNKTQIVETLRNYKIEISKIKATVGPTVTLYEIVPAPGVRISKIKNLEDDIALSLAALGIRIIAPIPGKGTIGIEVPNTHKNIVSMKSMLASEKFVYSKADLPVAVGRTISNENYIADLARMPHLLIAGATGQGKSVGINSLLISLLYKKHPSELKFVLVDPKKVELSIYSLIENHYLAKLPNAEDAIITDTAKVVDTLNSLCIEMDERYELLKNAHCRNIKEYNKKFKQRKLNPENGHRYLPYIVLVIDEFADLIMTAGKEVESPIARLAQLARAIGIHLIIATQRPSVNIITGIIKANFPARIAFRVMSKIDSRTILDMGGADQLIGRGDLILSIGSDAIRLQCPFVDTPEVEEITKFISQQQSYGHAYELPEFSSDENAEGIDDDETLDDLFFDAARMVVQSNSGSTSMLQRRLKLGYNRAGRIMDQLERAGVVGSQNGSKPRDVLIIDEMELERFLEKFT